MTTPIDTERRLVAIFAADVEGYSRLMGADEVGTLQGLTHRRAILDGLIGSHRGRIANTAGDSVLAEFGSAVDAVQCAVAAQETLAGANAGQSPDRHINYRIGIHVGDVVVKRGDLFGDGVNIAARLEGVAEPGGICLSDDAYRQVRGKIEMSCDDMGLQTLKNIAEPMRAWRMRVGGSGLSAVRNASMGATRRLAAILVADVVGYSRLLSNDGANAQVQLDALRHKLIQLNITKHSGRLFKATGDGFFAEFASVVQAVKCAIAIQSGVEHEASGFGDTRKLRLRIGIHFGDVMAVGDDLIGDGAYIAARLEGISAAGGISISRAVHDQVRDWIDVEFEDKGEINIALGNITRLVHVFAFSATNRIA